MNPEDIENLSKFLTTHYLDLHLAKQLPDEAIYSSIKNSINHFLSTNSIYAKNISASILISDLRGFTHFSQQNSSSKVIEILNRYFSRMIDVIQKYNGRIDKFIGDSIMVIFTHDDSIELDNVLACAITMQIEMEELNEQFRQENIASLHMGIGINTGEVVAGYLGSEKYSEYTHIGNNVNLASRVESYSMRGQVLISENSLAYCKNFVTTGNSYEVKPKGHTNPINIYELRSIDRPEHLETPRSSRRKFIRVNVSLLINFSLVTGKDISSKIFEGEVIDISYGGICIITTEPLPLFSEIHFSASLSIFGLKTTEIYAKVVQSKTIDNEKFRSGLEYTVIDDEGLAAVKKFIDSQIQ